MVKIEQLREEKGKGEKRGDAYKNSIGTREKCSKSGSPRK